jgi:NAD(P)-dependent dehydrogenase (short-subunit alcohol dehydrogenase family)
LADKGRLRGKRALVTGSTQGLGEAIARRFVAEGARVVITGRHVARGRAVARSLGHGTTFIRADLGNPVAVKRLGAATIRNLGGLDVLVNSAALPERSTLASMTVAHFEELFRINVLAPLLLSQAALPSLSSRSGAIINIGSVNAYVGAENLLVYAATKGAMMTISRNLSASLREARVRVHCLNVGWMDSDGERALQLKLGRPRDFLDEMGRLAPTGRLIKPAEVAGICVALATDEGAVFSGAVIDLEQAPVGVWTRAKVKKHS